VAFFSAGGKFRPKIIDFLLRLTVHHKGDSFRQLEYWTTIESDEFLAFELELDRHDRVVWPARDLGGFLVVASDLSNLRVFENGRVKLRRLFGLVVELEAGRDFLRDSVTHGFGQCWDTA
jgi:hypothetical protein